MEDMQFLYASMVQKQKNYLIKEAIFSDETALFRTPPFPSAKDSVRIRIRTAAQNAESVFLCTGETAYCMEKKKTEKLFDYYELTLPPTEQTILYYFRIEGHEDSLYFSKLGVSDTPPEEGLFSVIPDYCVPGWAMGAVMYQIFVDRYANGDPTNDVVNGEYLYYGKPVRKMDWSALPEEDDFCSFYGGDLQGVCDHLEQLRDMGVEALYLNPIFVSPSSHKYDIQDYSHIDPHFGKIVLDNAVTVTEGMDNTQAARYITRTTKQENLDASDQIFVKLTEKAHNMGIRVLLDGVFNHCGSFHWWLDREGIYGKKDGAYWSTESPYRPFFYWMGEKTYEGWWGYENHPKLNYDECLSLREYMYEIGKKWVSAPFYADGWRLDVAADLGKSNEANHLFWQQFRKSVSEANPEAFVLAEHYGEASQWLNGKEWDTVMNYDAFMEPVSWFFTGVSKHSTERREDLYANGKEFWESILYEMAKLPFPALVSAMNQLSNHDHSRFLTRTNGKVGRLHTDGRQKAEEGIDKALFRAAVLLQMTWIGSPTVYYGDEAGLCGWTDPDNRRPYPWGKEDQQLLYFHKAAIRLRKSMDTFRLGSLFPLAGEQNLIAYGRFDEKERIAIVFYTGEEPTEIDLPVWCMGCAAEGYMEQIFETNEMGYFEARTLLPVKDGVIHLCVKPKSGIVLREVRTEHEDIV